MAFRAVAAACVAVTSLLCASTPAQSFVGDVSDEIKVSATAGGFSGQLESLDWFGRAVAAAGDVDGNGIIDLAIGTPRDDDGGEDRGAVWICFLGAAGQVIDQQKISDLEGGFAGVLDDFDTFGMAVAPLGDLNGDGTPDLAVGAREDDDGGETRGAVYVLFLNPDGTVLSEQKISQTEGGFTGQLADGDQFGTAVDFIEDLDGDGVRELLVGANNTDDGGLRRGAVWICFLQTDGTVKHQQKISQTQGGFEGELGDGDRFGIGASRIGDLDGDGLDEIAVGAFAHDVGGINRGSAWVLFLNADGTVAQTVLIADQTNGFGGSLDDFDYFGAAVAGPGDLDGDEIPDLVVGARRDDDGGIDKGAVWVLRLTSSGTVAAWNKISATSGAFGGALDNDDEFGRSVGALGDLDGDGVGDLIAGANYDDDGGFDVGAAWILRLRGTVWEMVGEGIAGTAGIPRLRGSGSAEVRSETTLRVSRGRANSPMWWILGLEVQNMPFHGGVLVPTSDIAIPDLVGADGRAVLVYDWPDLGTEGFLAHQAWIRDPETPDGFASTNGVTVTAP